MEDRAPPDASSRPGYFLPTNLNIIDGLELSSNAETLQAFHCSLREPTEHFLQVIIFRYDTMAFSQGYGVVQDSRVMIDGPAAREPPDDLRPCMFTCVKINLKFSRLKTS